MVIFQFAMWQFTRGYGGYGSRYRNLDVKIDVKISIDISSYRKIPMTDKNGAAILMVLHGSHQEIPPNNVSIYTSTSRIRHGIEISIEISWPGEQTVHGLTDWGFHPQRTGPTGPWTLDTHWINGVSTNGATQIGWFTMFTMENPIKNDDL